MKRLNYYPKIIYSTFISLEKNVINGLDYYCLDESHAIPTDTLTVQQFSLDSFFEFRHNNLAHRISFNISILMANSKIRSIRFDLFTCF